MFGALIVHATMASAAPEPAEPRLPLAWEGPPACGPALFVRELARYFPEGQVPLGAVEITIEVSERDAGLRLELRVAQGEVRTQREFEAERCATVSEAAAFVAAVTIDPSVMDRLDEAEAEPVHEVEAEVEPAREAEAEPVREVAPEPVREPSPWHLRAAAGPAGLGLPGVGALVRLAGDYVDRRLRAGVHGSYRSPGVASSAILDGAGGRLSAWALGVRGCWTPRIRSLAFPVCLGAEAGQVIGRGFGFAGARTSALPWLAVVPAAELVWSPWRWLALVASVEPAVVILRHSFVIEGLGPVYDLGPVSLRGLLGLEIRLGTNKRSRISR